VTNHDAKVCWEFKSFDLIIWLHTEDGVITDIGYWNRKGFNQPKLYRYNSEISAESITIDLKNRQISISHPRATESGRSGD
jgi:hypothetical protein